jgi:hypothetical protein
LRAYPRYTVVAEKLEALTSLGIANSRMKDYFDLWILATHAEFDGATLAEAIRATFDRRGTPIPTGVPFGLSEAFSADGQKQTQWRAFLRKNALEPITLNAVLSLLRRFLKLPLDAARSGDPWSASWHPDGGWN